MRSHGARAGCIRARRDASAGGGGGGGGGGWGQRVIYVRGHFQCVMDKYSHTSSDSTSTLHN